MSQGFAMADKHPKDVPATSAPANIAPAARKTKRAYNALSASSVGLELGIAVIVGLLGGMWLDNRFGTTPWLMLVFLVLGLVAGFRNVLRAVERAEKAAAIEDREEGRG
jgi:ATP synthase protein I